MAVFVESMWHYHWQWMAEEKFLDLAIGSLSYFAKMIGDPAKLFPNLQKASAEVVEMVMATHVIQ